MNCRTRARSPLNAKWISVAKRISADKSARVVCPECNNGILIVTDEIILNGSHVERWMRCNTCGKANTLLMTREQVTNGSVEEGMSVVGENDTNRASESRESGSVLDVIKSVVKSLRR